MISHQKCAFKEGVTHIQPKQTTMA